MLLAVATSTFVCVLAICVDVPELIPATAFPCLAWYTWRIYRVSILGTVLGVVTLELVTGIVSLFYHSVGSIFDLIWAELLILSSLGCMLASVVTFLVHAVVSRVQRRQNFLAAVAACVLPILWFAIGPLGASVLCDWKLEREIARSGLPEFIAELSAVTQRLGRAPKDEAELLQLLGKPPRLSRGGIRYNARGGTHFTLEFGYDLDCYTFDSETPERGWHRVYGAPPH